MHRLHGSPIEWQEAEQELLLHLPPRVQRMVRPLLGSSLFFAAILVVIYASDGWLPGVIGMAAVLAVLLSIAYLKMRVVYLTDTLVTITPERVTVKAIWGGRDTVTEFALQPGSRAWQWYSRGRSHGPEPGGIVIADQSYDQEAGDDPNDRSKPRFGGNLTPGEMDWVEWRVNLFLDRIVHAAASPSPAAEEKPAAPRDPLVRIEQDQFETRIYFPNTVATGSYTGIFRVLLGLVLLPFLCAPLIVIWFIWKGAGQMPGPEWLVLLIASVLGILGLASTSDGLTQLFGRRQLTISPQRVRYGSSVLGIGVWWTLRTADILSVWDPRKHVASRRPDRGIAGAQGAVIRTARRQISLDAVQDLVRSGVGRPWLADEISRRIVAARARAAV